MFYQKVHHTIPNIFLDTWELNKIFYTKHKEHNDTRIFQKVS